MRGNSAATVSATRIGGHAYRYLHEAKRTGTLVSRFTNGVNLLLSAGEAIAVVQTPDVPFHPWGIEVQRLTDGARGDRVSVDNGRIAVGDGEILFSDAPVSELRLPAVDVGGAASFLRHARTDLGAGREFPHDAFHRSINKILTEWEAGHEPHALLGLLGLGSGATPSGDDILVGFIAGLSVFEGVDSRSSSYLDMLRADIRNRAASRTALLSAQMLFAACDRAFAEPILELLSGLTDETIEEEETRDRIARVARLGHRSGTDFLRGLETARRHARSLF